MAEENILFKPVREFCQRDVVTCPPEEPLVAAAATMRDHNISSVVVSEGGTPLGIVTDRDLRNKVVAAGTAPDAVTVRDVMNAPLITIGEEEFLFEALYRMSRKGIHRVGVVDAAGRLSGIITNSDIHRLQTRSPQRMVREIEEAGSVGELRGIHDRVQSLVRHLVGTGVSTPDLVRLISHLNDRLQLRLVYLLREDKHADLPDGFAFVVLGSEGRREQTLTTDQDNAIIYADHLAAAEVDRIKAFSEDLIDGLIAMGVPECPGGIMARNAIWRRSVGQWKEVLDEWLTTPVPENILKASMFADLRTLCGDPSLEQTLKEFVAGHLQRDAAFLHRMAANVLRFPPPLGWFGRIKTEKSGEHRGELEIKKAGIFAITEGAKTLALETGFLQGGTRERIAHLEEKGILPREYAGDVQAAYDYLVFLRLRSQVQAVRDGREPSNHVPLSHLNRMEKGRLKLALEQVKDFQGLLERRYRLNLVR